MNEWIDEVKSGGVYSEVEIISNNNPTVAALFKISLENLTGHEALIYETESFYESAFDTDIVTLQLGLKPSILVTLFRNVAFEWW